MKYQAFAWDKYPNGAIRGEAHVFNSMDEANDWLKFQPQINRMVVPLNQAPNMFAIAQGEVLQG